MTWRAEDPNASATSIAAFAAMRSALGLSDQARQNALIEQNQDALMAGGQTPEALLGSRLSLALYADRKAVNGDGAAASDGEGVASWADARDFSSATLLAATQATAGSRPKFVQNANGAQSAIRFNGTLSLSIPDNVSLRPETGNFYIFAVVNAVARKNGVRICGKGNSTSTVKGYALFGDFATSPASVVTRLYDGTTRAAQSVANPLGSMLFESHLTGGTTVTGYLNGSNTGWANGGGGATGNTYASSIDNTDALVLGSSGEFDLFCLYVVKGAMTADEIATVRRFLTVKYTAGLVPSVSDYTGEVAVFKSGIDATQTRIPALVRTNSGTLLAFCEARAALSDTGYIKTVVRRSTDDGDTWGSTIVVADDGVNTYGNPACVVDRDSGRIHLLLCWNLAGDTEAEIVAGTSVDTRRGFYTYSDDDGETWSSLVEITSSIKPAGGRWLATGPNGFEQLANGRLVIPCDYSDASSNYYNFVAYSDDNGETWAIGATQTSVAGMNETTFCQFADGTLLFSARDNNGGTRRFTTTSADNGSTFAADFAADGGQSTTAVNGSLCHAGTFNDQDVALLSIPSSTSTRADGTVYATTNNGLNWPAKTMIRSGYFAYSSMVRLDSRTVGILFEYNNATTVWVGFAKFTLNYPLFANP